MNPVVIGNATLYLGDCREILPTLPKVDAVITDPPYGIGYVHGGHFQSDKGCKSAKARGTHKIVGDDSPFDPAHIFGFCENVITWGANHYRASLPPGGRFLVWNKFGDHAPWRNDQSDCEIAFHSKRGVDRLFSHLWKGCAFSQLGESDGLINGRASRLHVTQKPVRLMHWCIERAGEPQSILDPYMGSGTTGVAALERGRSFIGCEIDPKYFEIACRRIEDAQRQSRLIA